MKSQKLKVFGFTAIEILIVVAMLALMSAIILTGFVSYRHSQIVVKDTELVIEVLREARSLTLQSKNSSVYGVHFETPSVTIFTGATYSVSATDNQVIALNSSDTILTPALSGGGSAVVFKRLSGETDQDGTITISSPNSSTVKTVTIYSTGLVE